MLRFYKKWISLVLAAIFCVGTFAGCSALDTSLPPQETQQKSKQTKSKKKTDPQKAIEQIYASLGKRSGLIEPTPEEIEKIGFDMENISQAYVRYVETDFGADDVYIFLPKDGEDKDGTAYRDKVLADLKERKEERMREFENYDVYNSTSIAANAVIFERGSYVVMLMLEDNDAARRIVERYIPERLNLS